MKKLIMTVIAVLFVASTSYAAPAHRAVKTVRISTQTLPVSAHVQWAPNASTDNVSNYLLSIDGAAAVTVATTTDPTCSCINAPVSFSTAGTHTVSVTAQNLLISTDPTSVQSGTSSSVSFSINLKPGAVVGLTGKK